MDLFSIKTPKHHLLLSSSPSFTCWGERAPENGSRDSLQTPWIWEGSEVPGMKSHSPVLHPSRWASPQRSSCNQTPASRSLQWCWARGAGWQWRQQVACGSNKRNKISLKKNKKKIQSTFIQRNITPGRLWGGNLSHLTRLYKSHLLLLVIAPQWMNAS